MNLSEHLGSGTPAIVAILRGVRPDEVEGVADTLIDAGIRIIEVPMNSPQPLASIERLAQRCGDRALVGAGTVTSTAMLDDVAAAGGRLIVAPNANAAVIRRGVEQGLDVLPGVLTPTEAFMAIDAGATHLKFFPSASMGPSHIRALREVLPTDCAIWAVGGVAANNLGQWLAAGALGVGIGGSLYKPGATLESIRTAATELIKSWNSQR